jgi:electron transport complex protein RnfC
MPVALFNRKLKTFLGGSHPPERKELTRDKPVEEAPLPDEIIIPLIQHTGAPCQPLVEKGATVAAGQKIGESDAFISAPVHSSVSGTVTAVEYRMHFSGNKVLGIVIKPDGEQKPPSSKKTKANPEKLTPEEVRSRVKEAGIVGLGGAAFPTYVKLSPPPDKPIDSVIINGCECEPFITCDHRNMLERSDEIVFGLKTIMKTVGAEKGYIAVEENKEDAAHLLSEKLGADPQVQVILLHTKYPQGAEKQLIKTILNREIPSGKLPSEVGASVQNVGTTIAISEAVKYNKPLIERVLTVSGSGISNPKNLRVKIGTPIEHLINYCGGFKGEPGKVIMGGPMTGIAQADLTAPVVKGTSAILVFPREEVELEKPAARSCIRCGRCVEVCPMHLIPSFIGIYANVEMWSEVEKYRVLDCIECGSCAYVCPNKIPLIELVKLSKLEILAKKRK